MSSSLADGRRTQAPPSDSTTTTNEPSYAQRMLDAARLEKRKLALAAYINGEFQKCKTARQPFERQWYLNLAFMNGRHYVSPANIPGQGFKLVPQRSPSWRVKMVVNKCRTAIRTETSKLTSSRPIPTVIPATNDNQDFAAAGVAEELLKAKFGTATYEKTYRSFIWWGSVTGSSFMKIYWDKTAKDYTFPQEKKVVQEASGLKNPVNIGEHEPSNGDIKIDRITPFHIFVPDLLAEDINEQPYVIHAMTQSPDWVKKHFPEMKDTVTCDTRAANTVMDTAFLITKNAQQVMDSVLIKEVWFKPGHSKMPEGGVVTVINDRVVQYIPKWPYPFSEYPFYKYDGIPTGGFYSDSILVDLIPLNKEYNRTRSQMVEIKNTMGKPKLVYQKGSINPRQITSEPGQAIPYLAGFNPPIPLPAAEVPATMIKELEVLSADFDDLSGQHEVARGQAPGSVTSGVAISFLQEQDDAKLTYQVASIELATELIGKHYLKFVSKYWDLPRVVRTTGTESYAEAKSWKGSDLRGNTDVKVQTGSALPYSKAARTAMLTEFMQMGWINPHDGLELMKMGGLDKVIDEILVDKKQAMRENLKMMELTDRDLQGRDMPVPGPDGMAPPKLNALIPVNSWDNHEAHIHFHNQFRKTQQFELLSDAHKREFELHVQTHIMAMQMPAQGELGTIQPPVDPEQAALEQQGMQAEAQVAGQEQQMLQQERDAQLQQMQADTQMQTAAQQAAIQEMQVAQETQMKAAKTQMDQALTVAKLQQAEMQTELLKAQVIKTRRESD